MLKLSSSLFSVHFQFSTSVISSISGLGLVSIFQLVACELFACFTGPVNSGKKSCMLLDVK
jgi:hypothetical protein